MTYVPPCSDAQVDAYAAEIRDLQARGLTQKAIAAVLHVSPGTVRGRLNRSEGLDLLRAEKDARRQSPEAIAEREALIARLMEV